MVQQTVFGALQQSKVILPTTIGIGVKVFIRIFIMNIFNLWISNKNKGFLGKYTKP